ncbi:ATP-grasp domain-containing protein [Catellatospora sp. KI3]|uniref:ATP-grasp domain-containing protein n=1 Tax=Catellatospora sp. KI3 TaxID=3041620 RepID=UPI002482B1E2|nr:ATP-grasp domain-containing protein [Catellatospora sp. KI3]MDI1462647.1 ATP-grasp domain-containing protein [Catellatospora sp. KI3]
MAQYAGLRQAAPGKGPARRGVRLPDRLPADTAVLVSDIVTFLVEYRLFVLDATVHAASRYAVNGRLDHAPLDACPHRDAVLDFASRLLADCAGTLPGPCGRISTPPEMSMPRGMPFRSAGLVPVEAGGCGQGSAARATALVASAAITR